MNSARVLECTNPYTVSHYSLVVDECAECGRALGECLSFARFDSEEKALEFARFLVRAELRDEQAVVVRFDDFDSFEGIASVALIDGIDCADEL